MNKTNFSILIDYAHEPESLSQFLKTLANWRQNGHFDLVIHILSCDGVGRDDWKKPIMGSLSYKYADFTILTTDNYGEKDNPQEIVELLGKDFIDKDELLSKEWLDYHRNLEFDEEKEFKKTKKVKFLLEIDRKSAMKKSLKVGQFLASNYDYLFQRSNLNRLTKGKINKLGNNLSNNLLSKWNLQNHLLNNTDKISGEFGDKIDIKNIGKFENEIDDENSDETVKLENENNNLKNNLESNLTNLDKIKDKTNDKNSKINFEINRTEDILAQDYSESFESESELETLESGKNVEDIENLSQNQNLQEDLESNLGNLKEKPKSKLIQELGSNLDKEIKVLIVSTGVGCEPFLSQPSGNLPWNEKEIWQEIWTEFEKNL